MRLYERDYSQLTVAEEEEWQRLREKEVVSKIGDLVFKRSNFREYPKAVRHHLHLFPNNYLDIVELQDAARLNTELEDFRRLLDSQGCCETDLCKFIRCKQSYFIIGSIFAWFHFGHHGAFLFPEFQLGNSHEVDYVLVGSGSGGWEFVFVEMESPSGKITTKRGSFGDSFRKGIAQVSDWEAWLQANYASLRETFDKAKRPGVDFPREFTNLDTSRLHYVVVAGRRQHFNEKTYRERRSSEALILHYDNLIDDAQKLIGAATY